MARKKSTRKPSSKQIELPEPVQEVAVAELPQQKFKIVNFDTGAEKPGEYLSSDEAWGALMVMRPSLIKQEGVNDRFEKNMWGVVPVEYRWQQFGTYGWVWK